MTVEVLELDATQLVAAYRSHELSPVEVLQAVLDRAEETQPTINAFAYIGRDSAFSAARESERRWLERNQLSELDGVPVSIKDNIYVRDWPTRFGSLAIPEAATQGEDSPCVERLREAGAVVFGKTTLPDYAHKFVTDSPLTGITRNPHNLAHTPGGSSGGAAAAVAAGIGPLALGTDGGGSVRVPAAWSGIFGLKPSFGRVPHHPRGGFPTISHIGPMTRSVRDAALMLNVVAQPDVRDWYALPYDGVDYTSNLGTGLDNLRVAVSDDLGTCMMIDPEIAKATRQAFEAVASLGAKVDFDQPVDILKYSALHEVHWCSFSERVGRNLGPRAENLDPSMLDLIAAAQSFPRGAFIDAVVTRGELASVTNRFFEQYDLLLAPVINISAPEIVHLSRSFPLDPLLTAWANQAGLPAASVPCGVTSTGLPIGLQVIGAQRADGLVLRAAHAIAEELGRIASPMH